MPIDTRIAAVLFIVPFMVAICIVAVDSDPAQQDSNAAFTALLVLRKSFPHPEDPQ